jgi:hypothetical protein
MDIIREWRELFRSMKIEVEECPIKDDHPYNPKTIGWRVYAVDKNDNTFITSRGYLSTAYENILEQVYEHEELMNG